MAEKFIGQPIKRREDPRLIQGLATYVDDVKLPDMHYVAFLRSIYAHARIKKINVKPALKIPGVVAVFTGEDTKSIGNVPMASQLPPNRKTPRHVAIAYGKVVYVGEPVAAVVARDRYIARDAADLIQVEYEPLPVVATAEQALAKGSPLIDESLEDNHAFTWTINSGDVEAAFRNADRIIGQRMVNQRLFPTAMEPRGVVAQYHAGLGELTIWTSTQIPHLARTFIALMLGFPENKLRVIAPEVGGGFGSKLNVYGEEAVLGYIAMKTSKSVKWIETRRENFMATTHGRDQVGEIEIAVKNDGTVTGFKYKLVADLGACYQLLSPAIPAITGLMVTGTYAIPNLYFEVTGVFTNKQTTDAYRGAGRPEATYVIERAMDLVADELGMDPVEVRRKNFIKEFPYKTAPGLVYDSGNYEVALNKALEIVGYEKLKKEQAELRKQGRYVGIGLSSYVEICALGPSKGMVTGGFGWESATVRLDPLGKVTVLSGASPHGQGQETSFAQIVADQLGVGLDDIVVKHGDTAVVQYGVGTFGSRATAVGGTAVYEAAKAVREKAAKIAVHLLQVDPSTLKFEDGKFTSNSKSITIQEIAFKAHAGSNLPPGMQAGLEATFFYEPSNFTFPFGTHICVVELDMETGEPKIIRYVAVDDCGNIINPLLVEGQIQGGICQSVGQALYEEVVYDENGQLITGELMDYAIPKAHQMPWIESAHTVTATPVNPLGVKGVGEAGTIAATPAIVNAIVDALSPFGVRHIDMPVKPEKIWNIIKGGKKS